MGEWLSEWLTATKRVSSKQNDWLTFRKRMTWQTEWLSDWLTWMRGWLSGWLTDMNEAVTVKMAYWLADWLTDWHWDSEWQANWLTDVNDQLGKATDWLTAWFINQFIRCKNLNICTEINIADLLSQHFCPSTNYLNRMDVLYLVWNNSCMRAFEFLPDIYCVDYITVAYFFWRGGGQCHRFNLKTLKKTYIMIILLLCEQVRVSW